MIHLLCLIDCRSFLYFGNQSFVNNMYRKYILVRSLCFLWGFFDEFTFLIFNIDEFVDPFLYKFYSLCVVFSFPLPVF